MNDWWNDPPDEPDPPKCPHCGDDGWGVYDRESIENDKAGGVYICENCEAEFFVEWPEPEDDYCDDFDCYKED